MKLYIKEHNSFPIHLYIPNAILSRRLLTWIFKMAIHHEENLNNEGQATTMDLDKMVCLIDTLKDSVKHFGHYELVNLTSSAGDQVIIKM